MGSADGNRTLSIIHFLLRSTMVLSEQRSDETWQIYQGFSRMCVRYALAYAPSVERASSLPPPDWATYYHDVIVEKLASEFPRVSQIRLSATLDNRLYARSFPKQGKIEVSALTRELLRTINLLIWGYVFKISEGAIPGDKVDELDILGDVLPILLSWYRDVNVSRLPILRAQDERVLFMAMQTTRIQLTFLLAHEYAHLVLHGDKPVSIETEGEADRFAYETLMNLPWSYKTGDMWTAIRWLFRVIALERAVGQALYSDQVDWDDQSSVLKRQNIIAPYIIEKGISREDNFLELTGTYLLIRAKHQLRDHGAGWLGSFASSYSERYGWVRRG
jgi:hypothetical protein